MSDVDLTALNGNFKERYANKIKDLVPMQNWLIKNIPNVDKRVKMLGNLYHQPVKLSSGQGYTYNSDGTAFTFNTPRALKLDDAQVEGFELVRSDIISFNAISRSDNKDKAFSKAVDLTIDDMVTGISSRLEATLLHGRNGLGVADTSANINTTHTLVTLTAASWAGGIWARNINAQIQFYTVIGDTLVSTGADSIFVVESVNSTLYQITVSGTTTGIAALDTALAAGDSNIYFNGAHSVEGTGLVKIASNTGSLFNIDAAAAGNALWKGNTYSASSGPLTFSKLQKAITLPVDKGLDQDVSVLVSTPSWSDLVTDQAAARRYGDVRSKKFDNGAEVLEFLSSNGTMEIVPHPMVKRGEAIIVPLDSLSRVGSTDITFNMPGTDENMFLRVAGKAGYEAVVYSDNTLFSDCPSQSCYISGIVPNA
jgi:hypothetical protein